MSHALQVTREEKIENIHSFCNSFDYDTKDIIQNIIANIKELTEEDIVLIDALWNSINGFQKRSGKCAIIEGVRLLGCVANVIYSRAGLRTKVMFLVVYFFKAMFRIVDLKELLDPKYTGLAGRIENTVILIDRFEINENVDEASLHGLISNFDMHIGVDQIGKLKSRITSIMGEGGDMQTCLHLLTLFVRLSTIRHVLLFRFKTCLGANDYSSNIADISKAYIVDERRVNKTFLKFFSLPSLENVSVLAVFDPAEHTELKTYLEELRLPLQNLERVLGGKTFLIQPNKNPSILLGRNFPSYGAARAMKSSTDVDNVRIQFEFEAVKESFNLFYIKSPDLKECLYMTSTLYCDYDKSYKGQTGAQWRIIQVKDATGKEGCPSLFVLCTRKQPRNFLYIENAWLVDFARGLEDSTKPPGTECLFRVSMLILLLIKEKNYISSRQIKLKYQFFVNKHNIFIFAA